MSTSTSQLTKFKEILSDSGELFAGIELTEQDEALEHFVNVWTELLGQEVLSSLLEQRHLTTCTVSTQTDDCQNSIQASSVDILEEETVYLREKLWHLCGDQILLPSSPSQSKRQGSKKCDRTFKEQTDQEKKALFFKRCAEKDIDAYVVKVAEQNLRADKQTADCDQTTQQAASPVNLKPQDTELSSAGSSGFVDERPRRRPGRPRKLPAPTPIDSGNSSVPKKRGRPRKVKEAPVEAKDGDYCPENNENNADPALMYRRSTKRIKKEKVDADFVSPPSSDCECDAGGGGVPSLSQETTVAAIANDESGCQTVDEAFLLDSQDAFAAFTEKIEPRSPSKESPQLSEAAGKACKPKNTVGEIAIEEKKLRYFMQNQRRKLWRQRQRAKFTGFTCSQCGKVYRHRRAFDHHLRGHGGGPASCRLCRQDFPTGLLATHHTCHKLKKQSGHWPCRYCDEVFTVKAKLQKHQRVEHKALMVGSTYKHFCDLCNQNNVRRGFVRRSHLYRHYQRVHAAARHTVCTRCGQFLRGIRQYDAHMALHAATLSRFTCDCGQQFEQESTYRTHLYCHTKYDCAACGVRLTTRTAAAAHARTAHADVTQPRLDHSFQCDVCRRVFFRPRQLEQHLRIHTGEKPHECGACGVSFRTLMGLQRHELTDAHLRRSRGPGGTPQRTHLCPTCGKTFARRAALLRHQLLHTDEAKPFSCPHCPFTARELGNLQRHTEYHFTRRNYVCDVCGAAFHAKKTLQTHHQYKHTLTKDFQCDLCEKSFKTSNSLSRHKVTHTDRKDHKCTHCGVSFNRFYNLRRHMYMVHNDEESLPPVRKIKVLDAPDDVTPVKGIRCSAVNTNPVSSKPVTSSNQSKRRRNNRQITSDANMNTRPLTDEEVMLLGSADLQTLINASVTAGATSETTPVPANTSGVMNVFPDPISSGHGDMPLLVLPPGVEALRAGGSLPFQQLDGSSYVLVHPGAFGATVSSGAVKLSVSQTAVGTAAPPTEDNTDTAATALPQEEPMVDHVKIEDSKELSTISYSVSDLFYPSYMPNS